MAITILNHGVQSFTSAAPPSSNMERDAIRIVYFEEEGSKKTIELLPPDPDNFLPVAELTEDHLKSWVEDAKAAGNPETEHN
jgi:hypothetical protein